MATSMMRLNFAKPDPAPGEMHARYRAGVEMAQWAEQHGVPVVTLEEHHGVPNGWSPSPLVTAAAILAGTTQLEVSIRALLLPLHDPLSIAEDIAVIDILSAGRLTVLGGIGHRPEEYAAHGKDWINRGAAMDECVDALLKAWTAEPFEYRGTMVRVTPKPHSESVPFMLAGTSKPAARRAARFRLPIFFAASMPALAAYYVDQCEMLGWEGRVTMPPAGFGHQFIVDDPDKAWAELGGYLLHEATVYAGFQSAEHKSAVHNTATTVDELRAQGTYRFMTPGEAVAAANAAGDSYSFNLHPLCGGMPIDVAWEMLERWGDDVAPERGSCDG